MPRGPYGRITGERVEKAKAALQRMAEGGTLRETAKVFGIPKSTLLDMKNRGITNFQPGGSKPRFSPEEELSLANHLEKMTSLGGGFSRCQVVGIAREMAKMVGLKKPGNSWYRGFIRRHQSLRILSMKMKTVEKRKKVQQSVTTTVSGNHENDEPTSATVVTFDPMSISKSSTDAHEMIYKTEINEDVGGSSESVEQTDSSCYTDEPEFESHKAATIQSDGNSNPAMIPARFMMTLNPETDYHFIAESMEDYSDPVNEMPQVEASDCGVTEIELNFDDKRHVPTVVDQPTSTVNPNDLDRLMDHVALMGPAILQLCRCKIYAGTAPAPDEFAYKEYLRLYSKVHPPPIFDKTSEPKNWRGEASRIHFNLQEKPESSNFQDDRWEKFFGDQFEKVKRQKEANELAKKIIEKAKEKRKVKKKETKQIREQEKNKTKRLQKQTQSKRSNSK